MTIKVSKKEAKEEYLKEGLTILARIIIRKYIDDNIGKEEDKYRGKYSSKIPIYNK
jgi:hypothetical protein